MKNEYIESLFLMKNSEVYENSSVNEQKSYYYDDKRERNIFDEEKIKTSLGTETVTKVDKESTDRDEQNLLDQIMGTKTLTEVENEGTDTDKDDDNYFIQSELLGTETKTFTRNEETDSDKENFEDLLNII